jgi:hypothetical protein
MATSASLAQELLVTDLTQRGAHFMLEGSRDTLDYQDIGKRLWSIPFSTYTIQRPATPASANFPFWIFLISLFFAAGAVAEHTGYDFLDGKLFISKQDQM